MKHRTLKKEKGSVGVIFIGALFSAILLAVLSFVFSLITGAVEDPLKIIGIMSTLSLLLTAAISGFAITVYKGDGGLLTSVLSATLFVLLLVSVSLIFGEGSIAPKNLLNFIAYFLVALLVTLFASRPKRHRSYK